MSSLPIADLYQDHHQKLSKNVGEILERLKIGRLLIHSGMLRYRFLDDQAYPFRVNPHFNYWVPLLENPNCFLSIEPGKRPTLYYYKKTDFWHKMPQDPQGFWTPHFEIKIIKETSEVKNDLGKAKGNGKGNGIGLKETVYLGEWPQEFSDWGMAKTNPEDLLNELHFIRSTKTPYEFHCLREANKRGAKGHKRAEEVFYQGYSEFEIDLEYTKATQAMEFDRPYNHIVALNENGAILHYNDGQIPRLPKGQIYSFLIDAGCGYLGYAADITRTYAFQDGEFKDLIAAMEEMQLGLIKNLKHGDLYTENQNKTHLEIAKILRDFQFVSSKSNMSLEAMVENKVTYAFYPHGVGHFLGLQVHDVGGYLKDGQGHKNKPPANHPYLRCTGEVREGHIFTVEPGLYFIPSLLADLRNSQHASALNWDKIESFKKYGGIRIEDNIGVHKDRFENFTRDAFK